MAGRATHTDKKTRTMGQGALRQRTAPFNTLATTTSLAARSPRQGPLAFERGGVFELATSAKSVYKTAAGALYGRGDTIAERRSQ